MIYGQLAEAYKAYLANSWKTILILIIDVFNIKKQTCRVQVQIGWPAIYITITSCQAWELSEQ